MSSTNSKASCAGSKSRTCARSSARLFQPGANARTAMLVESGLNIYILGSDLTHRQRQRIQAQVRTALRSLPTWLFDLVRERIDALGVANLPLIIEPLSAARQHSQVISLGRIDSRPTVKLTTKLRRNGIDWGQDLRRLLAKAVAYISAPGSDSSDFWRRWADAGGRGPPSRENGGHRSRLPRRD